MALILACIHLDRDFDQFGCGFEVLWIVYLSLTLLIMLNLTDSLLSVDILLNKSFILSIFINYNVFNWHFNQFHYFHWHFYYFLHIHNLLCLNWNSHYFLYYLLDYLDFSLCDSLSIFIKNSMMSFFSFFIIILINKNYIFDRNLN